MLGLGPGILSLLLADTSKSPERSRAGRPSSGIMCQVVWERLPPACRVPRSGLALLSRAGSNAHEEWGNWGKKGQIWPTEHEGEPRVSE